MGTYTKKTKVKIKGDLNIPELGLELKRGDALIVETKIDETPVTRLYSKMEENDCGTITAYRTYRPDGKTPYTDYENNQRARSLYAKLSALGYSMTRVNGYYIENFGKPNAKEIREDIFFVEDFNDLGHLRGNLIELGIEFEQDSILYIPRGGTRGTLYGTNKTGGYFPIGKSQVFGSRKIEEIGQFMIKRSNRPFFYESLGEPCQLIQGSMGRKMIATIAKIHWSEMDVDIKL